jgi:hypothetical protein
MTHVFTASILLRFSYLIWPWTADSRTAISSDDHDDKESQRILAELENIDDECDQKGIAFVKIDDDHVAREYGVDSLPMLVYFENKIPSLYFGDLANEEEVLAWLFEQLASDTIEDITDEMLDKLIKKSSHLAVLFCKSGTTLITKWLKSSALLAVGPNFPSVYPTPNTSERKVISRSHVID